MCMGAFPLSSDGKYQREEYYGIWKVNIPDPLFLREIRKQLSAEQANSYLMCMAGLGQAPNIISVSQTNTRASFIGSQLTQYQYVFGVRKET